MLVNIYIKIMYMTENEKKIQRIICEELTKSEVNTSPYSLSPGIPQYVMIVELSEESKKINFYKLTYETDDQLRRAIEIIKEK